MTITRICTLLLVSSSLILLPARRSEAQTGQRVTLNEKAERPFARKSDEASPVLIGKNETAAAAARHERVAARRQAIHSISHRGAVEFACENTMEAYRAAFELGADGLEIDIRATKDGVLVCFHDDMTDHLLEAYGDVADYTRDKLVNEGRSTPGQRSRTTLPSTGSGSQTVQECTTARTLIEYG